MNKKLLKNIAILFVATCIAIIVSSLIIDVNIDVNKEKYLMRLSCEQWLYNYFNTSNIVIKIIDAYHFPNLPKRYIKCYAEVFTNCTEVEIPTPEGFTGCYNETINNKTQTVCYAMSTSYNCKEYYNLHFVSDMEKCGIIKINNMQYKIGCRSD